MGDRRGGGANGRLALLGRLIDDEPAVDGSLGVTAGRLERLCTVLARVLPASGAGVSVFTEGRIEGGTAATWGPDSRAIEELQHSLGEGPCIDAFTSRRPVLEPDLLGRGIQRWPAYGPAAHAYGVGAVFALPLQVGGARLGALGIYRAEPGPLAALTFSQAITFAEIAVGLLIDGQDADGGTVSGVDDLVAYRAEVYQAQGMVMVDLGVTLSEAMARLRGFAYSDGRPLSDVAHDVLAGILQLNRDTL
ncbi:GAF and ANTAR domain-containing protein [Lapillicoccus sp.]|uniref:GAF and ANTAR domain-containing protein n=1 Tax=Lapillicoccus sp. TaxID=1909287 RepID=UPI0025E3A373|nr:GAF and ANTAR domain-containing protein [Lapillicoccus sp.]